MTQLKTVIEFELNSYFKNKGYILSTVFFSLLIGVILFIPSILQDFGILDDSDDNNTAEEGTASDEDTKDLLLIYDASGQITDVTYLEKTYPNYKWEMADSKDALENDVKSEKAYAGFEVTSPTSYDYVVNNSMMYDDTDSIFNDALAYFYRSSYMKENNIDAAKMEEVLNTEIQSTDRILGKDSVASYGYTYVLIFVIYFMIIMYGQMIATSVTSEKSNRAIEVLITSAKPDYLIFGKVLAGAIASFLQIALVVGVGMASYNYNSSAWNGMLDSVLVIPTSVLVVFFVFLVFNFFFYSFLYASLGALVSKTEDISKSTGPVMMLFIIGFMLAIIGLNFPDGMLVKVTSFIPFTSAYMMLIRAAMGTVSVGELIISGGILVASSVLVGIIGAKVYRLGTLYYGNPLKLRNALGMLMKEKNN